MDIPQAAYWVISVASSLAFACLLVWDLRDGVTRLDEKWDIIFIVFAIVMVASASVSAHIWWHIITYVPTRVASLF